MAARGKKPIPKTQREISTSLQTPYDLAKLGNPNDLTTANRATKLSFREDNTKPFSLGIVDIDESIKYYIENVIKPTVIQNGERIAQLIIAKHERAEWLEVTELSETSRGEGGFGSTGVK